MNSPRLTLALVTDVFPEPEEHRRLLARLRDARAQGAELAVLPELPLNLWAPATPTPSDADAEPPGGPRASALAAAARAAGLAVLGGAIVRDPSSGRRYNTAVLLNGTGEELLRYRKIHLPDEEGYWEAHHYEPGDDLHAPVDIGGFGIGVQVCSDANRPEQPVAKPPRRSTGDASRLNRPASRCSALRFGRNTPGIPPSRALSAERLTRLGAHAGFTTGY